MPVRPAAAFLAAILLATAAGAVAPAPAAAAGEKVAVLVGPTAITDSHYRPWAEDLADTARATGATAEVAYCPTPAEAKAAVQGASIIVYFGHGNGFPNPYSSTENPLSVNGWGLRDPSRSWNGSSCTDSVLRYYGEDYLTGRASGYGWTGGGIAPAPNFVMVYSNACYAPGAGEARPAPAPSVALSRVSHYSTPILQLGGTFFATDLGSERLVDLLLRNPTERFGRIFELGNGFSATALERYAHPAVAGNEAWTQKTTSPWLGTDYWYAFAGNPSRTPSGAMGAAWPPLVPDNVERLAGADRFGTAAAVSAASFAPGVPVAYVATGDNFPDALAAGAAAAEHGGPVLLARVNRIPDPTILELARLRPQAIRVVGGPGVISDGVLEALRQYATSGDVQRLWGQTRYGTAAAVSQATFGPGVPVAFVATGANYPDALAGVAAAGAAGAPILLTQPNALPAETAAELTRLRPGRLVVLGGSGVVSDGVATALAGYTTGPVSRMAGLDRYATSAAVSSSTFGAASTVFVATGASFPDALGGGPVAGGLPGPLLLVRQSSVPDVVAAEIGRLGADRVVILGGTGVVSSTVASQLGSLASP